MGVQSSPRTGQGFGGDTGVPDSASGCVLPGGIDAPVDIGTMATTVGATVAPTYQKMACGDVETIGCDLPICICFRPVGWERHNDKTALSASDHRNMLNMRAALFLAGNAPSQQMFHSMTNAFYRLFNILFTGICKTQA